MGTLILLQNIVNIFSIQLFVQEIPKIVKEEELVLRYYCQQIFMCFGHLEETKALILRSWRVAVSCFLIHFFNISHNNLFLRQQVWLSFDVSIYVILSLTMTQEL